MPNGTVKFFNPGKGFGFITPDGGAKDVFVPAASIAAAGVALLKTGQRISFEESPDTKGPKAVNLKLLETPAAPKAAPEPRQPRPAENTQIILYCDPSLAESEDILAGLRAAGHTPHIVDYIATPPTRDKLKELAGLLRGTDRSLVRRYEHLFDELRLDDRFIGENEFWDAIVEHPTLINGPVVTLANRAAVCHSAEALQSFLAPRAPDDAAAAQRKTLSPALLKLMGHAPAAQAEIVLLETKAAPAAKPLAVKAPAMVEDVKPKAKIAAATKTETKPAKAKPVVKAKAKPAPKIAPKIVKAPAKKPVAKPAKKAKRG